MMVFADVRIVKDWRWIDDHLADELMLDEYIERVIDVAREVSGLRELTVVSTCSADICSPRENRA